MSYEYNEDNLVEQAASDILKNLGWKVEKAWHNETFSTNGLLGRENKSEIILSKFLLPILEKLNPNLPKSVYKDAYLQIAQREADKKLDRIKNLLNE